MAAAIMVSAFGCTNGMVLAGARVYYAMARDGLFFKAAGELNGRGVPAVALALQALWAGLLTLSGSYGNLLDYVIFAALLFYVLTVGGIFRLRRTRPDAERPYKAWGYPVTPLIFLAISIWMLWHMLEDKSTRGPSLLGLATIASGLVVYYLSPKNPPPSPTPAA